MDQVEYGNIYILNMIQHVLAILSFLTMIHHADRVDTLLHFRWPFSIITACTTLVFSDNLLLELNESVVRTNDVTSSQNFHSLRAKFRTFITYVVILSNYTFFIVCRNLNSSAKELRKRSEMRVQCYIYNYVPYYKGCERYMSHKSN